ncbi:BOS complex subunit TMEM147 isoform X2 [Cylas formicarius]|uniref:BOS complex subunit TMEM147 isoform X2 n=1 Tax=Cylas formicarius TaxID=197179 RepID=UPI00295882AC|nr:BOS complex subunit TMEM147 isoform X2 [Cylas formicarius]
MTLYHFGNCIAIIYMPYYLTYKRSGLSDYGAFWKCVYAGVVYMFTQLTQMLILATFFPDTVSDMDNDWIGEFLKYSVGLTDLVGLYYVLNGIPTKGHNKILTAAVGWATAEVILSRALLLWVGARGIEFDWIYILKCLESNIALIQHIATAALIWLWSRHDLNKRLKFIGATFPYKHLEITVAQNFLHFGSWRGYINNLC